MFSGEYDRRSAIEIIEDNGLPKPNAYGMPEYQQLDGLFSSIGKAFSSIGKTVVKVVKPVAKVAVPAAMAYYGGGGAQGAGQAIASSLQKPQQPSVPQTIYSSAPDIYPQPQSFPPTYQLQYPQQGMPAPRRSFLDENPWVLYAGGGTIALLGLYVIINK